VIWQDARPGRHGLVPEAERAALLRRTNRWKTAPHLAPARACLSLTEKLLARLRLADNVWAVARLP